MNAPAAKPTQQDKVVRNYRNRTFILTGRKFGRIVEVSKERMDKLAAGLPVAERFAVTFANSKDVTLSRLEDVLALDNGVKNRIVEVKYLVWADDQGERPHWLVVDYDAQSSTTVQIAAASSNITWMEDTVGALEEQVDRTIASELPSFVRGFPEFAVLGSFIMATLVGVLSTSSIEKRTKSPLGLSQDDSSALVSLAKTASSDHEKLDFIFRYLRASLEAPAEEPSLLAQYATDHRTYLIGIPLLVAAFAAFAALKWFSPRNVFVWGDLEEHYTKLTERRKFLWYGVVASLVIGVLGNLFILGVSPSLGPK